MLWCLRNNQVEGWLTFGHWIMVEGEPREYITVRRACYGDSCAHGCTIGTGAACVEYLQVGGSYQLLCLEHSPLAVITWDRRMAQTVPAYAYATRSPGLQRSSRAA